VSFRGVLREFLGKFSSFWWSFLVRGVLDNFTDELSEKFAGSFKIRFGVFSVCFRRVLGESYLWHNWIWTKGRNWISKMKKFLTFFNCLRIVFKFLSNQTLPHYFLANQIAWIWKRSSFDSMWCWLCISMSLIIQVVVSPYSFEESIFSCLFLRFSKYTLNILKSDQVHIDLKMTSTDQNQT